MRNLLAGLVLLVACATSSQDLASAKHAVYNADPHQIFQIAQEATLAAYKIGEVDEAGLRFKTVPRAYSATGDLESPGAGGVIQIRAGSVIVTLVVEVLATADHTVAVRVTPITLQALAGSPKPRELKPDDPYLPPWVLGRADQLQFEIYDRARSLVAAPPGT